MAFVPRSVGGRERLDSRRFPDARDRRNRPHKWRLFECGAAGAKAAPRLRSLPKGGRQTTARASARFAKLFLSLMDAISGRNNLRSVGDASLAQSPARAGASVAVVRRWGNMKRNIRHLLLTTSA